MVGITSAPSLHIIFLLFIIVVVRYGGGGGSCGVCIGKERCGDAAALNSVYACAYVATGRCDFAITPRKELNDINRFTKNTYAESWV